MHDEENDFQFISNFSIPENLLIDNQKLQCMINFCDEAIELLNGKKTKQIFNLKYQKKFFYKKVKELWEMRRSFERQRNSANVLQQKISKLKDDIITYEKNLSDLRDETFEMKSFAEEKISKILNSNVKIIGDICKI